MKNSKLLVSMLVLCLCLVGCNKGVDEQVKDEVNNNQTSEVKEIIDEHDEVVGNETNNTTSSSVSNKTDTKVIDEIMIKKTKTENKDKKTVTKPQKQENPKGQETEKPKIPEETKQEDIIKPSEPIEEEKPKEPVVEEKEEVQVIEAYLSKETLQYINKERIKLGLNELIWDSSLENAVLTRAKETDLNYSHIRPDGTSWSSALPDKPYQLRGEILTERYNASDAVKAWMNSPSHKESMLDPDKTHGVVAVYNNVYVCITVRYF